MSSATPGLDPASRTLRARIAAYSLHAQGGTNTGPARAAFYSRFLDEVDPDRALPEPERLRRADHARRAHMARLALRSAQARRRRTAQDGGPS